LLIHIGYHKAGSTWLQAHLFDNSEVGFANPYRRSTVREVLLPVNPFDFDPDQARRAFAKPTARARDAGLVPVLTTENLVGHPTSGGYNRKEAADRLASVFPDARILVVIREQRAMIVSSYKQYVRKGGAARPERYVRPVKRQGLKEPLFNLDYFLYDELIAYYRGLFGENSVLALPYELFAADPYDFTRRIVEFAGANAGDRALADLDYGERENPSSSALGLGVIRPLNGLLVGYRGEPPAVSLPGGLQRRVRPGRRIREQLLPLLDRRLPGRRKAAAERRLRDAVGEAIGEHYAESNGRTAGMIGFDLASYGYQVGRSGREG
jgi:hypothetical protein